MAWSREEKRQKRALKKASREASEAARGIVRKPAHRPPKGKRWDEHDGTWVAISPSMSVAAAEPSVPKHRQPRGRPPNGGIWDTNDGVWREANTGNLLAAARAFAAAAARSKQQQEALEKEQRFEERHEMFVSGGQRTLPSMQWTSNAPLNPPGHRYRLDDMHLAGKRQRAWERDCERMQEGKWDEIPTWRFADFVHFVQGPGVSSSSHLAEAHSAAEYRAHMIEAFVCAMND